MAVFLPVAPPNILAAYYTKQLTHRNAFFLAHEVVKDKMAYRDLVSRWRTPHIDSAFAHRILDNSVIELGNHVDFDMVAEAYATVENAVVVLPDVLEKGQATFERAAEAMPLWSTAFRDLMFVPQGESFFAWCECLESFLNHCNDNDWAYPKWIGIPRNTTSRIVPSRKMLIDIVRVLAPNAKIHLLGFSDYQIDDFTAAKYADSIDSAVPMRTNPFLMSGVSPKRGDWWDRARVADVEPWVIDNIIKVQGWVSE